MWREVSRPLLIAAAGLLLRLEQTLCGFDLRDLVESRERLESQRRSEWAEIL